MARSIENIIKHDNNKNWLQNISYITSINEAHRLQKYAEYDAIYECRLADYHQQSIMARLKLRDKYNGSINYDKEGNMFCTVDNDAYYYQINAGGCNKKLNIRDLLVEPTLGASATLSIMTYSVSAKPQLETQDSDKMGEAWLEKFEKGINLHDIWKQISTWQYVHGMVGIQSVLKEDGTTKIEVLQAPTLFIIPREDNITEVESYLYIEKKPEYIYITQHLEGRNIIEVYKCDKQGIVGEKCTCSVIDVEAYKGTTAIVDEVADTIEIDTGLNDFDIEVITGARVTKSLYGQSAFAGTESKLIEVAVRDTANGHVFDVISNPMVILPLNVAHRDKESGELSAPDDKIMYSNNPQDEIRYSQPPTSQIESTYMHREVNLRDVYSLLGVTEASLGVDDQAGGGTSGETLRKRLTATLNRTELENTSKTYAMQNAISKCRQLQNGQELKISITYSDGITLSRSELIENSVMLIDNKLSTNVLQIMQLFNVDEAEAISIFNQALIETKLKSESEALDVAEDEGMSDDMEDETFKEEEQ